MRTHPIFKRRHKTTKAKTPTFFCGTPTTNVWGEYYRFFVAAKLLFLFKIQIGAPSPKTANVQGLMQTRKRKSFCCLLLPGWKNRLHCTYPSESKLGPGQLSCHGSIVLACISKAHTAQLIPENTLGPTILHFSQVPPYYPFQQVDRYGDETTKSGK
jgi:hypothetical protein